MTDLKCQSCGAPLSHVGFGRYRCEYCGAEYQCDEPYIGERLCVVHDPESRVIAADVWYDQEMARHIPCTDLSEIALKQLSARLAEQLTPYMEVIVEDDIGYLRRHFKGRVRVIPPGAKY